MHHWIVRFSTGSFRSGPPGVYMPPPSAPGNASIAACGLALAGKVPMIPIAAITSVRYIGVSCSLGHPPDAQSHVRFSRKPDRPLPLRPIAIPRIRANHEFLAHGRDRHLPDVQDLDREPHAALEARARQLKYA